MKLIDNRLTANEQYLWDFLKKLRCYLVLYFFSGHQLITSVSEKGSPKVDIVDPLAKFKSMYGPTFV